MHMSCGFMWQLTFPAEPFSFAKKWLSLEGGCRAGREDQITLPQNSEQGALETFRSGAR